MKMRLLDMKTGYFGFENETFVQPNEISGHANESLWYEIQTS